MYTPQDLSPQTAENLQQRIQDLASLMSRVADSLHQGAPVELQHLSDEISSVQTLVQNLSRQLEEHPLLAEPERYVTKVGDILNSCQVIKTRQEAIDYLKRLQLVKSFDQNDQLAFGELQEKVSRLLQALTSGTVEQRTETLDAVLSSKSPLRALYELINRPEELSDDRWVEAQEIISESFGKRVAIAVLRGRAR